MKFWIADEENIVKSWNLIHIFLRGLQARTNCTPDAICACSSRKTSKGAQSFTFMKKKTNIRCANFQQNRFKTENITVNFKYYYEHQRTWYILIMSMQIYLLVDCEKLHGTKKWSFPLRISSVNLTKSAFSCGFSHIYWRNLQ